MPDDPRYSISELADLAGVTPRTVRYYLAQGLLPSPGATGPGVKYGEDHLDRLKLIRRLQRKHLPLAEIRTTLDGLSGARLTQLADDEAEEHSSGEPPNTAIDYIRRVLAPARPPGSSLLKRVEAAELRAPYPALSAPPLASRSLRVAPATTEPVDTLERSQWEHIGLAPDIELHVRRPLTRSLSRKVDRLVTIARELLEEDPS